jgi:hypothetical protein
MGGREGREVQKAIKKETPLGDWKYHWKHYLGARLCHFMMRKINEEIQTKQHIFCFVDEGGGEKSIREIRCREHEYNAQEKAKRKARLFKD